MTEILTESFCERCGTRYTFESSAPRTSRLGRVRTLSKGVRNFVMSDESSLSEAMAEARGEEEMAATSHQLDAFHQTFNFCLTCRQYTCGDCWNEPEGRCLTCAPVPGQEEAAQVLAASLATVAFEPIADTNGHEEEVPGIDAWPEMDLSAERLARVMEPPPVVAAATAAAVIGESEGDVETVEAVDVPEAGEAGGAADVAEAAGASEAAGSEATPGVAGVAPGQSLDEAIAAYEAMLASEEQGAARAGGAVSLEPPPVTEAGAEHAAPLDEPEAAPAAAAAVGASVEAGPVPVDVEPPVAASLAAAGIAAVAAGAETALSPEEEPQPEPVAAEPEPVAAEPEPVAAEPEPVAAEASPVDHVEQPTWPIPPMPSTLDAGPAPAPFQPPAPVQPPAPAPWLTVAPEDAPPPEWPAAPAWAGPANRRDVPTTLVGRPMLPQGDTAALWAASAKEVLGAAPAPFGAAPQPLVASGPAPQAQPCVSCGLSLSANARFCRRCGSRQA